MKKVIVDVSKINWKLLRKQKSTLIELLNRKVSLKEKDHIDGIIAMVDYIQDWAAEILGEKDVFGRLK
jgi:hypothetical protein